MLFTIAWRNIWRHKTRSLIIICAVALGLWAGIFYLAFYFGMIEQRINSVIDKELSHIQLHHPDFLKEYDIKNTIDDPAAIIQQIQKMSNVKAVAQRMLTKGMIANASGSAGIQINGIVPNDERIVTKLPTKITEGGYLNDEKSNLILVGWKLAKKLKLKIKSKVILSFQDKDGNIASGAFKVEGIFRTSSTPYDESNVFIKISDMNALNSTENTATEIAILLQSNDFLEPAQTDLTQRFKHLKVQSWLELSPEMNLVVSATDQTLYIFMAIILLALAFGIINTMLMAILERTREIGMLLALGMNKIKVFLMILYETLLLTFIGSPLGIALSLMTIRYYHQKGIDLTMFSDVYSSFGYDSITYPTIGMRPLMLVILMVLITALVSALFPARKALTLNPVEAMRH